MFDSGLYIVATPIGNLKDISLRALETLENADIIACEDTRISKKLFTLLNLKTNKKFICYENHREESVAKELVLQIKNGASVALISDAGSPLISDPGYKLVNLCRKENLKVCSVPGASALISALQISGLPSNRFMFIGFIENKAKARKDLLCELKNIQSTLIFYETAPRLIATLQAMEEVFQTREIAVARELTKLYEECINGTAAELISHFENNPPKGEIVIVVAPPSAEKEPINIEDELRKKLKEMPFKQAVAEVSAISGVKKSDVYALGLKIKDE
jgi:16S rRNA (cytidine1402-2'-O)-methyltransferase